MFQTKQVERQPEKQPQKKEASFPSTKASKYLNDTLLKYAKAGDIDALSWLKMTAIRLANSEMKQ